MSAKVDMSSLEFNRELVNTQAIGVMNHQCAYVRDDNIFQCNGMIQCTLASSYIYIQMHKSAL